MLRLPAAHPTQLSFPTRLAVPHRCVPNSLPRLRTQPPGAWRPHFGRLPNCRLSSMWERQDLPGSWGAHLLTCHALRPRWATGPLPNQTLRCCLLGDMKPSAPRHLCFRGSITQPARSLSTLSSRDCSQTTQDSLPTCWPALVGQDCPAGLPTREFQGVIGSPFPSHQALPGAPCPPSGAIRRRPASGIGA